jgi:Zn-dependent peptidase ImmA (M78 family)
MPRKAMTSMRMAKSNKKEVQMISKFDVALSNNLSFNSSVVNDVITIRGNKAIGYSSCVNIAKIKKAAAMLRDALASSSITPPFSIEEVIRNLMVQKDGKWFPVELIETDLIPYRAEGLTFLDGDRIKILIVKNYRKFFPGNRIVWTLTHELSHICLGHVFIKSSSLTPGERWFFDKEANKLVRELLLPTPRLKACIFEGEKITPLKLHYFSSIFGVSRQAIRNTLKEYGIIDSLSKGCKCPFYPDALECLTRVAKQMCLQRKEPLKECLAATYDSEVNVSVQFSII